MNRGRRVDNHIIIVNMRGGGKVNIGVVVLLSMLACDLVHLIGIL